MENYMKRRDFMVNTSMGLIGLSLMPIPDVQKLLASTIPDAVWVENGEPEELVWVALKEYGGIQRFISKGDVVVIKPNIGWDRPPELAANTNPLVVRELVKQCYEAGAKKVRIFDRTCNNPRRCYRNSQIEKYAKEVGAEVVHVRNYRFVNVSIPNGEMVKQWPIYRDYLEADKVINVPIAKHHGLATVTLGMKNLMGVMGEKRNEIHSYFEIKLTDIVSAILPTLTVIDAYRILLRNGPTGGNPKDVALKKTVIVSDCTVTADILALDLFDHKLEDVPYIETAYKRGLAKYNLKKLNLRKIDLST
jgi:uncharacterized protein (DUF362 family)